MAGQTITEALAELRTIEKRIAKKSKVIEGNIARPEWVKDPFEGAGGTASYIEREDQAIRDLETRWIQIRTAISKANAENSINILERRMMISQWLCWRREIADGTLRRLKRYHANITESRKSAEGKTVRLQPDQEETQVQINVFMDEPELIRQIEEIETILSELDGQLSLKNAQIEIDI
jgi:hypothetical protein